MSIIDKPTDYFNTKLYTGTGSSLANTGVGFQPDLTWIKGRSGATEHVLTDSVRGVTEELSSNDSGVEETVAQGLTAFGSDGFTVGTDGSYNTSSATYAAWNFKAGTSFTNDASATGIGTIDSTGSFNNDAGFSIVTYTGSGSNPATIKHGLNIVPKVILLKKRTGASALSWKVYVEALGNAKYLILNGIEAEASDTDIWDSTTPTSSVFTVGSSDTNNTDDYVAYCFAEKQGYSKFGSYGANENVDGPFIYLGFKPAWIMVRATSGNRWRIADNKRPEYNTAINALFAELSAAETTAGGDEIDLLSNGFKLRGTSGNQNASGTTYIYMAFAENPFVTSTGVPACAR